MEKKQRTTIWMLPNIMNSLDDMKSKAKHKNRTKGDLYRNYGVIANLSLSI